MSSGRFVEKYGPWAVVTGASDGIGQAFARDLAARGLDLVLVARRTDRLEALGAGLRGEHGIRYRVIGADLGLPTGSDALVEATRDLDVGLLVAAAGFGSCEPFLASDASADVDMLEVNCAAVLRQCHHFGPRLIARGRGGVVLMSSVVAFQGTPLSANYAATKAYIQSLAEALRREWRSAGVDVVSCAPGPVATGFAARAKMNMARAVTPGTVASETLSALGRRGTVRPGVLSKLLGWSLATAPRSLRVSILGNVMRGMARPPEPRPPR